MEVRPWLPSRPAAFDLSRASAFVMGPLRVEPSLRTVAAGERSEALEPRVMRVLVALAEAKSAVLSRDDLIALCWDGQIVGDNAINRVISRLRAVLAELAGDAVRLETITKVGFRLVGEPAPTGSEGAAVEARVAELSPPKRAPRVGRRWLLGGGVATAALAGASAFGWRSAASHRPLPEAVRLLERGNVVMKSARMGSTPEAIRLYGQAVKVDPEYAAAWGALSSSYRHALDGYGQGERRSYPQMVASAADRALALDPDQPDALLAKASIYPEYRNWLGQEKALRALVRRFPDHWYANARMGIVLQEVGRFEDALAFTGRVPQIDAQLAPGWAGLIRTLTLAGRFHQADAAYDDAMAKIAPHPAVWFTRYSSLLESQRFGEAAAFAGDPRTRPEEFPDRMSQTYAALATALADDDPAASAKWRDYVNSNLGDLGYVPRAAPLLAMLGDPDGALATFRAYLFGGAAAGFRYPAPGPLDLRTTQPLFAPSFAAFRLDPRFTSMLHRSGLEDYWKRSGSQPDFRRN